MRSARLWHTEIASKWDNLVARRKSVEPIEMEVEVISIELGEEGRCVEYVQKQCVMTAAFVGFILLCGRLSQFEK